MFIIPRVNWTHWLDAKLGPLEPDQKYFYLQNNLPWSADVSTSLNKTSLFYIVNATACTGHAPDEFTYDKME